MLIKFIKPDPRAGSSAQMDSHRGQQLIDSGAAVAISESAKPAPEALTPSLPAADPIATKATRRRAGKKDSQEGLTEPTEPAAPTETTETTGPTEPAQLSAPAAPSAVVAPTGPAAE